MAFYFKNIKEDIIMTEENEDYRKNNFCRFCEQNIESAKIRGHCHLTGKYRGPISVILMLLKKKVKLFHSYFTILVTMIVICSLKNWLIRRMIK